MKFSSCLLTLLYEGVLFDEPNVTVTCACSNTVSRYADADCSKEAGRNTFVASD